MTIQITIIRYFLSLIAREKYRVIGQLLLVRRLLKELSIRLLNPVGLQLKQLSNSHREKNKINISRRGA